MQGEGNNYVMYHVSGVIMYIRVCEFAENLHISDDIKFLHCLRLRRIQCQNLLCRIVDRMRILVKVARAKGE